MTSFVQFMNGPVGRLARIVAGLVLITLGLRTGGAGYALAVVGLVPLVMATWGHCMLEFVSGSARAAMRR